MFERTFDERMRRAEERKTNYDEREAERDPVGTAAASAMKEKPFLMTKTSLSHRLEFEITQTFQKSHLSSFNRSNVVEPKQQKRKVEDRAVGRKRQRGRAYRRHQEARQRDAEEGEAPGNDSENDEYPSRMSPLRRQRTSKRKREDDEASAVTHLSDVSDDSKIDDHDILAANKAPNVGLTKEMSTEKKRRKVVLLSKETKEMIDKEEALHPAPALAEPSASDIQSGGAPAKVEVEDLSIKSYMKNHWLTEGVEIDPRRSEIYNNALRIMHVMIPTLEMGERPYR